MTRLERLSRRRADLLAYAKAAPRGSRRDAQTRLKDATTKLLKAELRAGVK